MHCVTISMYVETTESHRAQALCYHSNFLVQMPTEIANLRDMMIAYPESPTAKPRDPRVPSLLPTSQWSVSPVRPLWIIRWNGRRSRWRLVRLLLVSSERPPRRAPTAVQGPPGAKPMLRLAKARWCARREAIKLICKTEARGAARLRHEAPRPGKGQAEPSCRRFAKTDHRSSSLHFPRRRVQAAGLSC